MKDNKLEIGGWQTDNDGQRYRMIGNIKEYETVITTSNGAVRESMLADHNERMAKASHERETTSEKSPMTVCPFKRGMSSWCDKEKCAMYMDGCSLRKITTGLHAKETRGQRCPILVTGKCTQECELYSNGCRLTAIK